MRGIDFIRRNRLDARPERRSIRDRKLPGDLRFESAREIGSAAPLDHDSPFRPRVSNQAIALRRIKHPLPRNRGLIIQWFPYIFVGYGDILWTKTYSNASRLTVLSRQPIFLCPASNQSERQSSTGRGMSSST